MTKNKILVPLAAVAMVAMMAISLVATTTSATAAVKGVTQSATTVDPDDTVVFTVIVESGKGDLVATASSGAWDYCESVDDAGECDDYSISGTKVITVGDDANDGEVLRLEWIAPDKGPATVTFSFNQGGTTQTATVKVRGAADSIELSILDDSSDSSTACSGTAVYAIDGKDVNSDGIDYAYLCSRVLDSAGNRVADAVVVYQTTTGTLSDNTDNTGSTGQVADDVYIEDGTAGTMATITATADGAQATAELYFAGLPDSCSITTDPTSVTVGGAAVVTVNTVDKDGGPVADGNEVYIQQVNSGQGTNAAILNTSPETENGLAKTTVIAAIQGHMQDNSRDGFGLL